MLGKEPRCETEGALSQSRPLSAALGQGRRGTQVPSYREGTGDSHHPSHPNSGAWPLWVACRLHGPPGSGCQDRVTAGDSEGRTSGGDGGGWRGVGEL